MLRYDRQTKPGLVALYDIRPGNGAGPFLQPRSPHGAHYRMVLIAVREAIICRSHRTHWSSTLPVTGIREECSTFHSNVHVCGILKRFVSTDSPCKSQITQARWKSFKLVILPSSSLQCFHWTTGRASGLQKVVCWFIGGDGLTGVFAWLQFSTPLPSSLDPMKMAKLTFTWKHGC